LDIWIGLRPSTRGDVPFVFEVDGDGALVPIEAQQQAMSLDEWKSLGATEQAVEDDAIDRGR
jgi:hypothetical protein